MINLASMTCEQVYTLYPAMLARHQKALEDLAKDSKNSPSGLDPDIAIREMNARKDLETLHSYFNKYSTGNLGWALNELLIRLGLNKYCQIFFFPGSTSYQKFGEYVGGVLVFSEEQLAKIFSQIRDNPGSRIEGTVYFDCDQFDDLTPEQKDDLKTNGFHCRDIYSVQWI